MRGLREGQVVLVFLFIVFDTPGLDGVFFPQDKFGAPSLWEVDLGAAGDLQAFGVHNRL